MRNALRALTVALVAFLLALPQAEGRQDRPKKGGSGWDQFGGSPLRKNHYEGKIPDRLELAWNQRMGCTVPGRAQFVTGEGLIFGSSP